ncbi:MAG: glycine cleavage system protein GcvH [Aggregatilineales bacterium]
MADNQVPVDLKYAKTDEWVRLDGDEAVIGITDYAQKALNDITYVEFPRVGETFHAGDGFGSVESVKAASDMHLPISGTVTAINTALESAPELINQDPYGKGWFARIKPSTLAELDQLMTADAYVTYCAGRA